MNKLRLRQIIGIIYNEETVEFFNANTRSSLKIKINFPQLINFLQEFDGKKETSFIISKYSQYSSESLLKLVQTLYENYIIINNNTSYPEDILLNNYRLLNLLEDYCHSTKEVLKSLSKIKKSTIMIIGLGSVGSFMATYLTKIGVTNFIFVDDDIVDISNLHRQYFFEDQIGLLKTIALSNELFLINREIHIQHINEKLTDNFFIEHTFNSQIDLIINCADEPNVDYTSNIIANFAMKKKIPHIIGGGYNLHLTLIGQTIIPFDTACFNCFNLELEKINTPDLVNVKKLHRKNRKVGSFLPLSGLATTLSAIDAFKVIIGKYEFLNHTNKRIEFSPKNTSINIIDIPKSKNCLWCQNE